MTRHMGRACIQGITECLTQLTSYFQVKHWFFQTSQVKYWVLANGNFQNYLLSMSNHIPLVGCSSYLLFLLYFSKMPASACSLCLCSFLRLELSMNAYVHAHPYYQGRRITTSIISSRPVTQVTTVTKPRLSLGITPDPFDRTTDGYISKVKQLTQCFSFSEPGSRQVPSKCCFIMWSLIHPKVFIFHHSSNIILVCFSFPYPKSNLSSFSYNTPSSFSPCRSSCMRWA